MPSLKQVREILNEAKFNPKEPGPLNIVAHSSGPSYLESRSMEFIMEAQIKREDTEAYRQKMIRGIQCLALAIIKVENGEY